MGDKSNIEWTDATWNPVTGCSKVSQGCKFCYAERVFPRAYGKDRNFTDVVCHEDRLTLPLRWKRSRHIFVNSMSDLFHELVQDSFIRLVFKVMGEARQHTFQVLTKRPQRMRSVLEEFAREGDFVNLRGEDGAFPFSNVWLGVSVENQETANERIPLLLQTPAAVRFVSYEPALAPVDFSRWTCAGDCEEAVGNGRPIPPLDWIIAGGESGPHARPSYPSWFRAVRDQCQDAGVAFFMKQLIEKGRKFPFENWPKDLQVRQFPRNGLAGF